MQGLDAIGLSAPSCHKLPRCDFVAHTWLEGYIFPAASLLDALDVLTRTRLRVGALHWLCTTPWLLGEGGGLSS